MYRGFISLMAHHSTEIHQFSAKDMPSWPVTPEIDCRRSKTKKAGIIPSKHESLYVFWMFHHIDKEAIPSSEEFSTKVCQAQNSRDKFSLLRDVQVDNFYHIIGEVVRMFDKGDHLTLYLTDYTANSKFYNQAAVGLDDTTSRDGDEYGYTRFKPKIDDQWPGPFGKMAIQLTLWDNSAAYVLQNGKPGDWILVENVRIKLPSGGGPIEGVQHSEKNGRIRVDFIKPPENPDTTDIIETRRKDAIRRKRDYWKKFSAQKKEFEAELAGHGQKRSAEAESFTSNKKRRKEKREEQRAASLKYGAPQQHALQQQNITQPQRAPPQQDIPHTVPQSREPVKTSAPSYELQLNTNGEPT